MLKEVISETHSDGKTALEHGRRDQDTTETFGIIGPMMVLVILKASKYLLSSPFLFFLLLLLNNKFSFSFVSPSVF